MSTNRKVLLDENTLSDYMDDTSKIVVNKLVSSYVDAMDDGHKIPPETLIMVTMVVGDALGILWEKIFDE